MAEALAEREKAQNREAEAREREAGAIKREAEQAKRVARRTLAGLAAALILALIAGSFAVYAIRERNQAQVQEVLANKETAAANEQRTIAVQQTAEAKKQKTLADEQKAAALEQKALADEQRAVADKQKAAATQNEAVALTALSNVSRSTDPALAAKLALAAWPRSDAGHRPKLNVALEDGLVAHDPRKASGVDDGTRD